MTKARDLANSAAAFASVSATELGYVDGVTSAIQTQMDAKAPSSTAVTLTGTQTLTNKTLTSPVIASVINNTLTSTTGDIIYASAANTPARLGIGTTGQVLNVASGLPAWSTVGASGLTKIVTANFSASAAVQISNCFTSTYVNYIIVLNALGNSAGGALYMNWMTGTNTVVNSGIYYAGGKSVTNGGTDTIFTNNNDTKFTIAPTIATATRQNFTINCSNVGNGSQDGNFSSLGNGSGNGIATTAGIIASSASTTGAQFTGNGNLTGTYTVYGLAL